MKFLPGMIMTAGFGDPDAILLIHDTFTALGNGTVLNGWTPDTVNTPGNVWVEATSGRNEGDGTGRVERDTSNGTARIDTGVTDNRVRVELEAESVTTKQQLFLAILANSTWHNFLNAGQHGLELEHVSGSDTLRLHTQINGVRNTLASTTVVRTVDTVHKYRLEYDGADVKVFFDDAEVTDLTQVSYALPAALDGLSFVGTSGTATLFWDNFKVWSLP